jgi:hypothetical protein
LQDLMISVAATAAAAAAAAAAAFTLDPTTISGASRDLAQVEASNSNPQTRGGVWVSDIVKI